MAGIHRRQLQRAYIEILKNEPEAVRHALSIARRDDLVAIFADRITKVAAQIDFEKQKETRG